jgi:beta-phosphoglucomutase
LEYDVEAEFGVIFDVDGVLVDSYKAHFRSWQLLGRERGLTMSQDQFVATFGRTSREIIAELWGDQVNSEAEIAELDDRKEALYRNILQNGFPAIEGAADLIDALHAAGFRLAVGSSGPPENVRLVLDRLERHSIFEGVITGADVQRGKPDPQVFQLGARRLDLPPQRCVVVEDAPAGIEAAHRAGMKCVALASTGRVRDQLRAAERVVDSLRELGVDDFRTLLST